jgi:hypothetical protein
VKRRCKALSAWRDDRFTMNAQHSNNAASLATAERH